MHFRRILFLVFFSGMLMHLPAQEPFFKLTTLPGELRDCSINTAMQDEDGFILLGTTCGLVKYDGLSFRLIENPQLTGGQNDIRSLFQDKDGKLWIGYKSGKLAILEDGNFTLFNPPGKINTFEITAITSDPAGRMWFSAYGHGVCYTSNDSIIHLGIEDGLPDQYVYSLVCDEQGKIWAASDAGISNIDLSNGHPEIRTLTTKDGLPDMMMQLIAGDRDGNIWAGSHDNGICRIESNTKIVYSGMLQEEWNFGPVSGIVALQDLIWVSTEGSGLLLIDKNGTARKFNSFDGKSIKRLNGLFEDDQGNIWSHSGNSLIMVPGNQFEFVKSDSHHAFADVHALMIDSEDFIWYATDKGLFRHKPIFDGSELAQKISLPRNISPRDLTCLLEDKNGYIWIGTYGQGAYRLGPNRLSGELIMEQQGLINNNVLSIAESGNDIWFATLGGASRYSFPGGGDVSKTGFENFDKKKGLGNNFIYCVYADSRGRIWFATDGTGITLLENGEFNNFSVEEGLSSEKVYTITEDKEGRIWCATHDNGIFYFDENRFVKLEAWTESEYSISALIADRYNNLLIVHENGISLFNQPDNTLQSFGPEVGIYPINPEFNSVAESKLGSIWIGTEDGLIKYNPLSNSINQQPNVQISKVAVFLEPINLLAGSALSWNQNHLTFDYIGLWYRSPEKVKYQVMLEGYDIEWLQTANLSATYSNLPAGHYSFKVRASQNGLFDNSETANYSFEIKAPFWLKWWFFTIILVLIGGLIYLYLRNRTRRLQRTEEIKNEKILFQFETLKSQINPHFLFNSFSTLISAIDEDKDMAIEYVERLSVFFRNILELRDKDLISMNEELELVENYVFLQKKRYGENLVVTIDIKDEVMTSQIPPLTLQLLLENAVKHNVISSANPLTINIRSDGDYIHVKNVLKRKPYVGDSTGFGLKTIQHRYLLFSKLKVKIVEEDGFFVVSLPVVESL